MPKTKINIRLYKTHDLDLIMLTSYGINISKLVKKALLNYVEGKNEKYYIPYSMYCAKQDKSKYRYSVSIENQKIADLMQHIKFRNRNAFCKALLRDMLLIEPLGIYFSQNAQIEFETNRIKEIANSTISPIILSENIKEESEKKEHHDFKQAIEQTVDVPSNIDNHMETDSNENNEISPEGIDFINRMEQLIGI